MAVSTAKIKHLARPRDRLAGVLAVARQFAGDVDTNARFPKEAFDAMKQERLLGVMIPEELGGEAASLEEITAICAELGKACSSTAMIFAMHQIKVSSLVTHGRQSAWHRQFMQKIVNNQLLLGSATTEAGIGGDLRNSICAIEEGNGWFNLKKDASVISYGSVCDAILVTARRHPDAAGSDQVMAVVERDQYSLEKTIDWDTMGMRGTCSEGFILRCRAPIEQVFPNSFAEIAAQSMLAMAHLMWAAAWYGIAADAVVRSQTFVRAEARKKPGLVPLGASRLARTTVSLQQLRTMIVAGVGQYETATQNDDTLSSIGFAVAMNNVKLAASEMVADIVRDCLMINGIAGYRNDSQYSVARHLRDALSAPLMVHNDRIQSNSANLLLAGKINTKLGE